MPWLQRLARLRFLLIGLALAASAWAAGAAQLQVLVDLDVNPATGCTVATPGGPFTGVEQRFVTTINTSVNPPMVTGVTREVCVNPATNTFGAPVPVSAGGWPVGVGLGAAATNAIETGFALPPGVSQVRLGFVYIDPGVGNQALLTAPGGGPIVIAAAITPANQDIPTLSDAMLALLAALVGAAAFLHLRRRQYPAAPLAVLVLVLATTMAWAAIILDGAVTDWAGIAPVASTPSGTAYATIQGGSLYARMDVATGMPPHATNDNYTATSGTTLNIPAGTGLLANDTLGNPAATVASYGGGSLGGAVTDHAAGTATTFGVGGSLTVNGDGSLSYTPATGFTGTFTFSYRLANASASSDGTVALGVQQAPAITSANATTFTIGTAGTFTVTATGFPAPTLSLTGTLPTGVTFNAATGVLSGTPATGTAGAYPLTFTAANGVSPNATQAFTLTVNQGTTITSVNAVTFTAGSAGTFTVTTSASPPASTISFTGTLPAGVSFTNNGDGTATIAGTPGAGTGGAHAITISATNGVGAAATQPFTLTVREAPQITSANAITFVVGAASPFTITATGFPVAAITETGALPPGVTLTDNGNGTATLGGIATAAGAFPITLTAANGVAPNATQAFTITVDQSAVITSAAATTFTVGVAGTFTVTTTGLPVATSITATGALPAGVTFTNNGNGTATIAGTPGTGTGGTYSLGLSASNGVGGPALQSFTLTVDEAPQFTSAGNATFSVGSGGTFAVTTLGFPLPALSETGALPAGLAFTDNGNGTATIAGTPGTGSGGVYALTLGAANGITPAASQPFTLTVLEAPVANIDFFTVVHDSPPTLLGNLLANDTGSPPPVMQSVTDTLTTCSSFPCSLVTQHGLATVASDGSVTYAPNANFAGSDLFDYTIVNSSGAAGSLATITVTNALPVVDLNGPAAGTGFGPVTWTEGAGAVAIVDPAQLTVTDADSTQLAHATVQITPLSDPGSEILGLTCPDAPPGCSGAIQLADVAYDPALGTLAIVRAAPPADYQALLRTLTYNSTSLNPTGPTRTVSVTVNDGIGDSTPSDATVTISAQNNAPTITAPATALAATDSPLAFAGTVSVADVDAGSGAEKVTLTVTNGTATLSGTAGLTVTGNGTAGVVATGQIASLNAALNGMTFLSSSGFAGAATLRVDIDDQGNTGTGGAKTATRTINVTVDQRPSITTTIPANGATSVSTANTLTVNFSEPVNATTSSFTIECPVGSARPYALSASPSASLVLTPLSALPAGTACRLTVVAAQITDSVGLNPVANVVVNFTTNTLPTVTSTVPTNGATAVATNSTVTFNFSESVNATGTSFTLECPSGSARAFGISASPSASFVLTPTLALPNGTTCVATALAAGITDADAGQNLAANATTSFTTTSPPAITSANATTFAVGASGTFSVTTTGSPTSASMVISETGALPSGVTFTNNNDGTATLAGTPGAGTGGTYPITITANNGVSPNATQSFTLTVNQAPAITSSNSVTFQKGVAATPFTVTTTGVPTAATITFTGSLPAGVNFVNNSNGTATISGTPTASGSFPITITANNGVTPNATQSFTITVNDPPAITSANNATFAVGAAGTFSVTTTGFPTNASMTISETGALPSGVSLVNNGNGTATLAGTPGAGTSGTYPITITAANGVTPNATQSFTLTVNQAPAITSANTVTFQKGVAATPFTVTTTGFPTVGTITFTGSLPAGVGFLNNSNGTATISGTPTAGGTFPITITANNGVTPNATQSFTISVTEAPAITSANNTNFFPGVAGTFTITTSGTPTVTSITEVGALPSGLTFTYTSGSTATISGTTSAVGTYPLTLGASNGVAPDASQAFTLGVSCPVIAVSPTTLANGIVGTAYGPVTFSASGGSGSYVFTLGAGAPPGLAFTGADLGGTPTDVGSYTFTVTATDNATGCVGVQAFSGVVIDLVANNDSWGNIVGNVLVDSTTAGGVSVVANDSIASGTTITAFDATSALGGTVNMVTSGASLGHFQYNPPRGQAGADSFTYTISKNGRSATGTVSFNINQMAWFINNSAGACSSTCDGRLTNPFTTLANFNSVNTGASLEPQNGHPIFIYTGSASYTGSTTLRQSQKLVGQGATQTFAALGGLTAGAGQTLPGTGGTRPDVDAAISFVTGNTLAGFDMDGTNPALSATSATGFTVNLGRFRNTVATNNAIQLLGSGNSGSYTFASVTASGNLGSTNNGVFIQNLTGTFTVSGNDSGISPGGGTISGYGGHGMMFNNVSQCGTVGSCGIAAVSLANMILTTNARSQTAAGNSVTCGGAIVTGTNTSCLANLYLQNVDGVTLNTVNVANSGQIGVNGNNVYRYAQTGGTITGNGNEPDEGGILFQNLHGTSSISGATIRDNHGSQVVVGMTSAGSSPLTLTVTSTSFANTSTNADRTSGLVLTGAATGTTTLNVNGGSFANNGTGFGIEITAGTSTAPLNLSGQVSNATFASSVGGVSVTADNSSLAAFNTTNNTFTLMSVESIGYQTNPTAVGPGNLSGRITGNTIGNSSVFQSACSANNCAGIVATHNGGGTNTNTGALQLTISGNTLQQIWNGFGISLSGNGGGSMQASVTSNTLRLPAGDNSNQLEAIDVNFATLSGSTITSCMNVASNGITSTGGSTTWGAGLFLDDIHTRARNSEVVRIPGYTGAATDTTAVQNFISGINGGAVVFSETAGGGTYANTPGSAPCTTP